MFSDFNFSSTCTWVFRTNLTRKKKTVFFTHTHTHTHTHTQNHFPKDFHTFSYPTIDLSNFKGAAGGM